MPMFSYTGRRAGGEKVSGQIETGSRQAVASLLQADGITPITITEGKKAALAKPSGNLDINLNLEALNERFFTPKVGLDELVMMCRQMHTLTRAGVVMNKAFNGLARSTKHPALVRVFFDIEKSMNQGVNLATSLRKHSDIFDDLFVSIIMVGENTGRLDQAFKQLAQYMEREKETRRSIGSAMRYPMFVLIAIAIAITILNIFVIPVFADMFSKFNAELPLPTKVLMATSSFFVNFWPFLLLALGAAIYGVRYYLATEAGRYLWDRHKLRLPVVGSILERAMLARFARTFSLMLRSGVPLIQALDMCAQAVGNSYLAGKIRDMRTEVERGESLLRITTNSGMFTPLVLQMIAVGEETGQVDELLEEVAGFYDQEVDYEVKNLSSVIEPILISVIAGIVGVLALGIFMPMWDMFKVVQ